MTNHPNRKIFGRGSDKGGVAYRVVHWDGDYVVQVNTDGETWELGWGSHKTPDSAIAEMTNMIATANA
jgi:hypothetical protein